MGTVRARKTSTSTVAGRPENHVARPRVVGLLERAIEAPLTLIAAPMGYGKTAAVRDLLATSALPRPAAFVQLARPDHAAVPFWDRSEEHTSELQALTKLA